MKKCVCGRLVDDSIERCPNCGSTRFLHELEKQMACSHCGANNPMHRSSCFKCGRPL